MKPKPFSYPAISDIVFTLYQSTWLSSKRCTSLIYANCLDVSLICLKSRLFVTEEFHCTHGFPEAMPKFAHIS